MKNICAIWDIQKAGSGLGSLLLFQEELLLYCAILKLDGVDFFFYLGSKKVSLSYLASLAQLNPYLHSLHIIENQQDIVHAKMDRQAFVWPSSDIEKDFSYNESTLHIQQLWQETEELVALESPLSVKAQTTTWIKTHVPSGCYPVAVHLKNNRENKQSNANQAEWLRFFLDDSLKALPVMFVLIGDDCYDEAFNYCPNCVITQNHGGSLELDLSLIQSSLFFMGMSSGPCNIAILSELPYLIWKHPDHHATEMGKELNNEERFVFSNEKQKMIRDYDCYENLINQFNWLFDKIMRSL